MREVDQGNKLRLSPTHSQTWTNQHCLIKYHFTSLLVEYYLKNAKCTSTITKTTFWKIHLHPAPLENSFVAASQPRRLFCYAKCFKVLHAFWKYLDQKDPAFIGREEHPHKYLAIMQVTKIWFRSARIKDKLMEKCVTLCDIYLLQNDCQNYKHSTEKNIGVQERLSAVGNFQK